MARKRPTISPVVYDNVQYEFIAVDIGDVYEGECPECSATLSISTESLTFHRDSTFSTSHGQPVECVRCDSLLRIDRGVATDYIGPRAEQVAADDGPWRGDDAA